MTKRQEKLVEVRISKKMQKIMDRWGVKLRPEPVPVTHHVYGITTLCSPSVYAVYETAIKANYVSQMLMHNLFGDERAMSATMAHYGNCLTPDDELPIITEEMKADTQNVGLQCDDDYIECVGVLRRAGLYYALLD